MEIKVKPDPAYKKKFVITFLISSISIILPLEGLYFILKYFNPEEVIQLPFLLISLAVLIIFWVIALPLTFLWIKNLSYQISKDRITISKGILTKTEINIPFKKITDFKLVRGILDRYFGLGTIISQTAGQGSPMPEGIMQGLLDYDSLHKGLKKRLAEYESGSTSGSTSGDTSRSMNDLYEELVKIRKLLAQSGS